jgi:hypothetical protein
MLIYLYNTARTAPDFGLYKRFVSIFKALSCLFHWRNGHAKYISIIFKGINKRRQPAVLMRQPAQKNGQTFGSRQPAL